MTRARLIPASDTRLRAHANPGSEPLQKGDSRWALVLDADRTLATPDTGRLVGEAFAVNDDIRSVFEMHGYSAAAFGLVSEIWRRVPVESYLARVHEVSQRVNLYPGWSDVLEACRNRVPVVVVTSGIPQVWRLALARHGFADVPVLGGCHPEIDDYSMNAETKRRMVELLQTSERRVVAAGDSLIDEPMLRQADLPIIVPDYRGSTSLRRALADVDEVRIFDPDERPHVDFLTITAFDLKVLLVPHAQRTHE